MKTSIAKHIRLPVHVTPIRYEIMLRPDFESFTFMGEETIELAVDKQSKTITLHSFELDIESAEIIHSGKDVWAGKISYDKKLETATFTFPKVIPKGKNQLKLTFRGLLTDRMRGFYRSKYGVNGQEKYLATTQFEATDARRAFPCFDEPAMKAIFDVTLMVPPNTIAISNTIESTIIEHESGYKVVNFVPTPKMSSYLLAFIVGDFEYIERKTHSGVLVRVFTTSGKKDQGKFALDVAVATLEFYEQYFAIPYPLPVMDLIAIPDFAFGAMENWGAVTYRESALLVDEKVTSSANKQWVALVVAHELAHQWFGNLVTMEWWTHIWLNEGFASYIEYLAVDHIFPEYDIWTQFVYLEHSTALRLDSLKNTHPIEVDVHDPNEIGEVFDKVSYSKGASVIRMIADYLGAKAFRDGLRYYLKKYSYSNASTDDLWQALEKVSGKPVAKILANWTQKGGHPVVTVVSEKKNLRLSQSRFFVSSISRKETNDNTLWAIPLSVKIRGAVTTANSLLDRKTIAIEKPKGDRWIKINAGESGFYRVDYPVVYINRLEEAVGKKELSAVDRLGIVRDAFDLAQGGQLSTHEALDLTLAFKSELDFTVWSMITSYINQVASLIYDQSFYSGYQRYCNSLFTKIVGKLGFEKKMGEAHTDTMLRAIVLYAMGTYGDKKIIAWAKRVFATAFDGEGLDPDIRSVVYTLAAENGGVSEHELLMERYKKDLPAQEKERIGRALASFRDEKLLGKTLAFSLSEDVRFQDSVRIINSVFANPKGRSLAWKFVKANWETLQKRYGGGGHMLARLIASASDFTHKSYATDINNFFKKQPTPEATRTIEQVLEQINSNAVWLSRASHGLRAFLGKF